MKAPFYKRDFTSNAMPMQRRAVRHSRSRHDLSLKQAAVSPTPNKALVDKIILEMSRRQFSRRFLTWRAQTASMSSPSQMMRDPTWNAVYAFGKLATRFSIERLKRGDRSMQLFILLNQANGFNAFDASVAGDAKAMAQAWIDWYQKI